MKFCQRAETNQLRKTAGGLSKRLRLVRDRGQRGMPAGTGTKANVRAAERCVGRSLLRSLTLRRETLRGLFEARHHELSAGRQATVAVPQHARGTQQPGQA